MHAPLTLAALEGIRLDQFLASGEKVHPLFQCCLASMNTLVWALFTLKLIKTKTIFTSLKEPAKSITEDLFAQNA